MACHSSQHHSLALIWNYIQNHSVNIYWVHAIFMPVLGSGALIESKSRTRCMPLGKLHPVRLVVEVGSQLIN